LDDFTEPGTQIIFFVKSFDLRKVQGIPEKAFDEAWFRFQNEETSQTLDYTKIKKMEAQAPEGYEGEGAEGEEAEEDPETGEPISKPRNELITIAGRVYREESTTEEGQFKWIYERWN
jgi:hypothetical protein